MLLKTRGLVLNYIKYRETSIIVKIYTEEFGLQSYIINGIRNKKTKTGIALFQPLTILDLVVYHKENKSLHRISEVKCHSPFRSIPFEIKKSSITMFIAEILNKTLKEETPNKELFDYLVNTILFFDTTKKNYENFHLKFLLNLSAYLGFAPSTPNDILKPGIANTSENELKFLDILINTDGSDILKMDNSIRRKILEHLLNFYTSHIENFGRVNSLKILKEVLGK
jgi:DNA repair protein RecO (recombination protein O)